MWVNIHLWFTEPYTVWIAYGRSTWEKQRAHDSRRRIRNASFSKRGAPKQRYLGCNCDCRSAISRNGNRCINARNGHHILSSFKVVKCHKDYIRAGAEVITTNSNFTITTTLWVIWDYAIMPHYYANYFGNSKFAKKIREHTLIAAKLARRAADECGKEVTVLGCLQPTRESLRPDLTREYLTDDWNYSNSDTCKEKSLHHFVKDCGAICSGFPKNSILPFASLDYKLKWVSFFWTKHENLLSAKDWFSISAKKFNFDFFWFSTFFFQFFQEMY